MAEVILPRDRRDNALVERAATCAMPDEVRVFADHLQAHATATEALSAWCAARFAAVGARLVANVLHDREHDPASYRGALGIVASERLRHRSVELIWGERVVSEAKNFYLPDRLPVTMQRALLEDRAPFGAVVAGLQPHRRVTAMKAIGGDCVLEVRAVVATGDGQVIAAVHERYRAALLG